MVIPYMGQPAHKLLAFITCVSYVHSQDEYATAKALESVQARLSHCCLLDNVMKVPK